MGRKLNTSRPTVIQTMLTPLSDMFSIQPSDTLEQWYYVNTGEYSPDRSETPLELTPVITAVDTSTETTYHSAIASAAWFYFDPSNTTDYSSVSTLWPGIGWVPVTAVEAETGGVQNDYYCPITSNASFKLYVQKNVAPPTAGDTVAGQSIRCVATYIDPRDSGVTVKVQDVVVLATSKDATSDKLIVNMLTPTKTIYNVLSSASSLFTFQAQVFNDKNEDVTSDYYIEWRGKVDGAIAEAAIDTLPCYTKATQASGKGQGTDTIKLDAMYVEHVDVVCRLRRTSTSAVLPFVAYGTLIWEYPKLDVNTICKNGRAVSSENRDMTFTNIINHKGSVLSDEVRQANFRFNFKRRISSASSYTDMGWGDSITVKSDTLRQTSTYATPVHAEVYMLGPYEPVTDNGEVVTDNGEVVYSRF